MIEEKQTVADNVEQIKAAKRAANIADRRKRLSEIKDRIANRKSARVNKTKKEMKK